MKFRTEIGRVGAPFAISHDDRIVLLGSCFADNVGERLTRDGFSAVHNPLGPLYNPASVLRVLSRGLCPYTEDDLRLVNGEYHCLDFANRYRGCDAAELLKLVNADYLPLAAAVEGASVIIITFGTTGVYRYDRGRTVAGNCHKIPAQYFQHSDLELEEIVSAWLPALRPDVRYVFTVSPVRYTSDGLEANSLSKATLRVAVERICRDSHAAYFPAFEILNDDLRDYRFYAADMKHPSDVAADYIYDVFAEAYFSPATLQRALTCRRDSRRADHRQIIP